MEKTNFGHYVGKVILVNLPNIKRSRYRWIVRKREDGRFIVRTPKDGVLVRDLNKKRDSDYGKETLLPKGATIYQSLSKRS